VTRIEVVAHRIGEAEIAATERVLSSVSVTTGPEVAAFEHELSDHFGATAVLACSSGTAALHLALLAARIGPGDEVITTTTTFPATANAVLIAGATPVLVDIDPRTLNIDPAAVEAALTPRTKAIMPVHLGGLPADMAALRATAARYGLLLIADCAHAVDSTLDVAHVAGASDLACFSFYATKNITSVEGGALVGPPDVVDRARRLARHGLDFTWDPHTPSIARSIKPVAAGFKYNLTDLHAAVGRVQLARLESLQHVRTRAAEAYDAAFGLLSALMLPAKTAPGERHSWYLYQVVTRTPSQAQAIRSTLSSLDIATGAYYHPLHLYDFYREAARVTECPAAEAVWPCMVALPMHARLDDGSVARVIDGVAAALMER
jgi:dTDP-4-amino-4,6-dideoxygalactose transaminase